MSTQPPIPGVGQIVALRQRLYLVEQSADPVKRGDSTLVRLACLDDDAQGQTLEVLWEKELDQQIPLWRSVGLDSRARLRSTQQIWRLLEHPALELRYLDRSQAPSISLSRRNSPRRLPTRTTT